MRFELLLSTVAIGAAAAQLIFDRDFQDDADTSIPAACQSAVEAADPIYDTQPTPPIVISASIVTNGPCSTLSFLDSHAQSQWTSYTSALDVWYTSNSAILNAIVTACSEELPNQITALPTVQCDVINSSDPGVIFTTDVGASTPGLKTTFVSQTAATPAPTPAPTGTATGAATGASSGTPTGAASRETGFAAAAVAAAGLIGAVAML